MTTINTIITQNLLNNANDSTLFLKLSGGIMSGVLILNGNPTQSLQAATKQYVDTLGGNFVLKTGDTMTGDLVAPNLTGTGFVQSSRFLLTNGGGSGSTALSLPDGSGIYQSSSGNINFATSNTERLRITNSINTSLNPFIITGSTPELRMAFSTFYTSFKSASITSNVNFILPVNVGLLNNVMQTDGVGNLSFSKHGFRSTTVNQTGGASSEVIPNSDIYASYNYSSFTLTVTGGSAGDSFEVYVDGRSQGINDTNANAYIVVFNFGIRYIIPDNPVVRFYNSGLYNRYSILDNYDYSLVALNSRRYINSVGNSQFGYQCLLEPTNGNNMLVSDPFSTNAGFTLAGVLRWYEFNGVNWDLITTFGPTTNLSNNITLSVASGALYGGRTMCCDRTMSRIIVGCGQNNTGGTAFGGFYVFTRSVNTFIQTQFVQPPGLGVGSSAGDCCCCTPDGLLMFVSSTVLNRGWLYRLSAGNYVLIQQITGTVTAAVTSILEFGNAACFFGNKKLIVSARSSTINGVSNAGCIFIFSIINYAPTGVNYVIQQEQAIISQYVVANARFGNSICTNNINSLFIGSPEEGVGATSQSGSSYHYIYNGNQFLWVDRFTAPTLVNETNARFGNSMCCTQDSNCVLYIAEYGNSSTDGTVYSYKKLKNGEIQFYGQTYTPSAGVANSQFGFSCDCTTDGRWLCVGRPNNGINSQVISFS